MAERKLTLDEFFRLPREIQNVRYKELSDWDKFGARQADVSTKETFIPCNYCSHYHGFAKCDAYPDQIPNKVINSLKEDEAFQCSAEICYEYSGHKYGNNKTEK